MELVLIIDGSVLMFFGWNEGRVSIGELTEEFNEVSPSIMGTLELLEVSTILLSLKNLSFALWVKSGWEIAPPSDEISFLSGCVVMID